jgi:hypothetical protein
MNTQSLASFFHLDDRDLSDDPAEREAAQEDRYARIATLSGETVEQVKARIASTRARIEAMEANPALVSISADPVYGAYYGRPDCTYPFLDYIADFEDFFAALDTTDGAITCLATPEQVALVHAKYGIRSSRGAK